MLQTSDLFYGTSGPRDAEVMIVGEAWGADEARAQLPFVGQSGRELDKMLAEAGFDRNHCFATNVVSERPPNNEFHTLLHPIHTKRDLFRGLHAGPKVLQGVEKLRAQIENVKPKLIIGCGNVPLWALTDKAQISTNRGYRLPGGIMKWRGSQLFTETGIPYLPVIHPAAILRSWDLRYITVHDIKARAYRYLSGTQDWKPAVIGKVHSSPSAYVCASVLFNWITQAHKSELVLSVDIETYQRKHIVCVGLTDGATTICIPFFYFNAAGEYQAYFNEADEFFTVSRLRNLLNHPNVKVVGQNFIYDYQFLTRLFFIYPTLAHDTMLAQNLLWPGTPKALPYLASLYCNNYTYWKDESQDWDAKSSHRDLWEYNCKDVIATHEVYKAQQELIAQFNLTEQFTWQLEQWRVAADMMLRGVRADKERKQKLKIELLEAAGELEAWLLDAVPPDVRYTPAEGAWFKSPKQQQLIFYNMLGLKPILHKKTKQPTMNVEALAPLRKQAPWLTPLFDRLELYRSLSVFSSHFIDMNLSFDGRIRCNFNVGGTETFRWSSSANGFGEGTNLQNIPKGEET